MALRLDNSNSETLVSVNSYSPPAQGSICFWLEPDNLSGVERPIGLNDGWEARMDGSNIYHDFWKSGTNSDGVAITTDLQHLIFTRDSGGNVKIYRNGSLGFTGSGHNTSAGSGTLTIGTRTGYSQHYGGLLDDLRVYNRVLSDDEAATIYAARGIDEIIKGLDMRLLFNEGAIGTAVSGVGSVKDIGPGGTNFSPGTNAPDYDYSILKTRRNINGK